MSDRLSELLRQRALLQEHVAWLDREIAAASASPRPAAATPLISVPAAVVPVKPALVMPSPPAAQLGTATPVPAPDDIIAQYQEPKESLHSSVRRGCFLYFSIAMALLALGVVALYLLRTKPGS